MKGFIAVSSDGSGFVNNQTNERFIPMGANYFDPKTGWAPKIWSQFDRSRVDRQMAQMAKAGLNCMRIFLSTKTLNPAENAFSEEGFAKVDQMVDAAKQAGLRIIFSGPSAWEGMPEHRRGDVYCDGRQMDMLCDLWTRIVERYGTEPTVMTWDLQNEPQVSWLDPSGKRYEHQKASYAKRLEMWKAYTKRELGREVAELPSPESQGQDREVYAAHVRFMETRSDNWTARQCDAIRSAGAKQMVSIGQIQWSVPIFLAWLGYAGFAPKSVARHLDYTSMHFYPMLQKPAEGLEQENDLQRAYIEIVARGGRVEGKPLVMEEFGWKGGKTVPNDAKSWPQEHQTYWCKQLMEITRNVASGWLNWGYADAADPHADISAASGLWTEDEEIKDWGKTFAGYKAELAANPPTYRPADKTWKLNLTDYLYDHGGKPNMDWIRQNVLPTGAKSVEVVFE